MARKRPPKFAFVGLFNRIEGNVDQLSNVVPSPALIEAVEVAEKAFHRLLPVFGSFSSTIGNLEPLAVEAPLDAKFIAAVFAAELFDVLARARR